MGGYKLISMFPSLDFEGLCLIHFCVPNVGFPGGSLGENLPGNAGDIGLIPGSGRSPEEGIGNPFQYSWTPWWQSWSRIHLQCGRPGFDPWVGKILWRGERLPTLVFWPGEFHGQRNLMGYSPWSCKRVRHDLATKQHPQSTFYIVWSK